MWRRRKNRASKELDPKEILALMNASNVSEQEIRQWHADFLAHYPSGRLNRETFVEYSQRLCHNAESNDCLEQIFRTIDVNNDGIIEFNELLVVIVLMSRLNSVESRLAFAFDMWDGSENGLIEQDELVDVISAMYDRAGFTDRQGERDPKKRAKEIMSKLDLSGDKKLSKEEFIAGCKNDQVIRDLMAPHA